MSRGDNNRQETLINQIKWAMGLAEYKLRLVNTLDESDLEPKSPFPPDGLLLPISKKREAKRLLSLTNGSNGHPGGEIRSTHRSFSSLHSSLLTFQGKRYMAIAPPHKQMVKSIHLMNNKLTNQIKVLPLDKVRVTDKVTLTPEGTIVKRCTKTATPFHYDATSQAGPGDITTGILYELRALHLDATNPHKGTSDAPNARRCLKTTGRFFPHYGYVANDEANPADITAGNFDSSDLKEWTSLHENCVFTRAEPPPGVKPIPCRHRRTYKTLTGGGRKAKTRFVVCARHDPRDIDTSTEMPAAWLRRLGIAYGLSKGWTAATIDVQTAFLLVDLPPENGEVYVQLPRTLPQCALSLGYEAGQTYRLQRSLYGLKEAPRLFNEFLAKSLEPLGWSRLTAGVFLKGSSAILLAYVDDLMVLSTDPVKDLQEVASIMKCSDLTPVDSNPQRHVGYEIYSADDRIFFDINPSIRELPPYAETIDALSDQHRLRHLSPSNLPLDESADETACKEYPPHHIHLFQQIMGALCWIGTCHPAMGARHGELSSYTHKPSAKAFRVAKGVLKELQEEGLHPLEIQAISHPEIRLWVDCAINHHSGRRGWILQLCDKAWPLTNRSNLIHWKTSKDRLKHASSTSGEVNAILQALEECDDALILASCLFPSASIRLLSDSMSGIQQILNGGHTLKARETSSYIKWLITHLPLPSKGLEHVSGQIQLADPLTKVKPLSWYAKFDAIHL